MQERRKVTRTRVQKGAKMLLGKSSVIDCVARDLTNSGAGLQVPGTNDLPESLDLTLDTGEAARTHDPARRTPIPVPVLSSVLQ